MKRENRIGETKLNNYNSVMTIIKYNSSKDVVVEFENGYTTHCEYGNFKKGNVKSLYDKSVYGVGYLGEGKFDTWINGEHSPQYKTWVQMLRRCYSEKALLKNPTYIGCSVCEEWLCFQVFAEWWNKNYYTVGNEEMNLDKDILHKLNKIYSPDNCIFVPKRINSLFVSCNKNRGNLPIGVSFDKEFNKFLSTCNDNNDKIIKIGRYYTPEDAFYKGYKPFKESVIKEIANQYKDKIPEILYSAMYNWIVEITD